MLFTAALACYTILVLFAGWAGYQIALQQGKLLLRLDTLERRVNELATVAVEPAVEMEDGLPPNSVVLDFELPDLHGGSMTLSQWRGRRVLLIFFSPHCVHGREVLPELQRLATEHINDLPVPIITTTGGLDANRALFAEHDIRCPILVQEDTELAFLYKVRSTPSAYLIGEDGVTRGPLVKGIDSILALAGYAGGSKHETSPLPDFAPLGLSSLPAGARAPAFRLPRLDGGELTLEEYRGRRVLLVFSDPSCTPCDRLAPDLERIHRGSPDLQVVMVSRRDPARNLERASVHQLTFPIAMQSRWEVSRAYGGPAAPAAYIIDNTGLVEAGAAVGGDAIIAMAQSASRADANTSKLT